MRLVSLELESRLREKGLWPQSRTARAGLYLLALALLLYALRLITLRWSPSISANLRGWVTFLISLSITLFIVVGFRWLRSQLLWRLRNRLIVTYVFIGVIPMFLLLVTSLITLYLLSGQFANYVVMSELHTHLHNMETANQTVANELAGKFERGERPSPGVIAEIRGRDPDWEHHLVCAWYENQQQPVCSGPSANATLGVPPFADQGFSGIVRDGGLLYLRAVTLVKTKSGSLHVISSEPLDKSLVDEVAKDLGEITLYGTVQAPVAAQGGAKPAVAVENQNRQGFSVSTGKDTQSGVAVSDHNQQQQLEHTFTAGSVGAPETTLDLQITWGTPLPVRDWDTGIERPSGALIRVETRPSVLYGHLFATLGDLARAVEDILIGILIAFAIIELLALFVGTRLTRSITQAIAQLYDATTHINRADFSHRIAVKSNDQLATLANSFNSMTASIENLILEQKEKQRLENELSIAQEVQAQLFPKEIAQLESLEVHGFCRPARTVSGDYYDFLTLNSEKMILAIGDISGKGISAALLMATIHSAVRAYSIEGVPQLREPALVGAAVGSDVMLASEIGRAEASPARLLALLNHQLFESTPEAKYATLFLGIYDGATRKLTYSNGGHLSPILISEDGSSQLLSCGGTVVGLFDNVDFPEATVQLRSGDIFVAYSDGITEPENDYGEFGEERLTRIVRENRHLPLTRITEIVTGAVDDWIGENEQPDDVTLVLARAR